MGIPAMRFSRTPSPVSGAHPDVGPRVQYSLGSCRPVLGSVTNFLPTASIMPSLVTDADATLAQRLRAADSGRSRTAMAGPCCCSASRVVPSCALLLPIPRTSPPPLVGENSCCCCCWRWMASARTPRKNSPKPIVLLGVFAVFGVGCCRVCAARSCCCCCCGALCLSFGADLDKESTSDKIYLAGSLCFVTTARHRRAARDEDV
mmetsp:Transcript_32274/g.79693  ORF Transcript_32274/g.79693 Transcript_32274/m.79693 type:complete len:205 (+) Transcript_32274:724-1338(+)